MTDPKTPDLDALERLLAAATARPWCVDDHIVTKGDTPEEWHVYEQREDDPPLATCFHGRAEADARLIAAAVNALPALIAAARERLGLMRAFGAISLAVAAIDGGSDNTPWRDVVERIETTGRRLDLSRRLHEQSSRERIAAESALAAAQAESARLRGALEYSKTALPVLATLCNVAKLGVAEAKAHEMITALDAALAQEAR